MNTSTTIAAFDTHALWQIAVGMGAVVLIVVIILLMLLLSFVKDIQTSVGILLETAPIVAQHTSKIPLLKAHPGGAEPHHRGGHHPGRLHERADGRLHRGR